MSRKIGFSLTEIAEIIPRYKAGTLTAKEMVEAMQQKVKEIDALIASKQLHRQMLIDHIAWFKSRKRKPK
jgi:MerR family copper efflux transcriptional regulator